MIIAVASQKGGTGKTTTSISLAAGLAQKGKKTLLIDVDSQANASKVIIPDYKNLRPDQTAHSTIIERTPLVIHKSSVPDLDIAPSHILLSNTDVELTTAKDHREARLKTALEAIKPNYDFIIIDCPPSLGWLTLNAFTAADQVLIVVSPGFFELDSLVQIAKVIGEVQEFFNPSLDVLGFLFTMSEPTVNTRTSLQLLRQTYGSKVLKAVIPKNVDLRDAHFEHRDIFTHRPNAKGALAYQKVIKELFSL